MDAEGRRRILFMDDKIGHRGRRVVVRRNDSVLLPQDEPRR
jgi:hypothetical protein